MFCIGLTGTVASGKSTAAKILRELGANVISADQVAREITDNDPEVIQQISTHFGASILGNDSKINRPKLRSIIFSNQEEKIWLDNLLHPLIRKELANRVAANKNKICVIEIPLLTDRSHFEYLDAVILLTANQETQIQRLIKRDNVSRDQALQTLNSQPDKNTYLKVADIIINNDFSAKELEVKLKNYTEQHISKHNLLGQGPTYITPKKNL